MKTWKTLTKFIKGNLSIKHIRPELYTKDLFFYVHVPELSVQRSENTGKRKLNLPKIHITPVYKINLPKIRIIHVNWTFQRFILYIVLNLPKILLLYICVKIFHCTPMCWTLNKRSVHCTPVCWTYQRSVHCTPEPPTQRLYLLHEPSSCAWRALKFVCRFCRSDCSGRAWSECEQHGVCRAMSILWIAYHSLALYTHRAFLLSKKYYNTPIIKTISFSITVIKSQFQIHVLPCLSYTVFIIKICIFL